MLHVYHDMYLHTYIHIFNICVHTYIDLYTHTYLHTFTHIYTLLLRHCPGTAPSLGANCWSVLLKILNCQFCNPVF